MKKTEMKSKSLKMSIGEHIEELKTCLIYCLTGAGFCLIFSLSFGTKIIEFLKTPYAKTVGSDIALQTLAPSDGLISYIRVCAVVALLIASPWWIYHVWRFFGQGLYPNEKKYFKWTAPVCMVLFLAGAAFFMFVVAPLMMRFLISFNKNILGVQSYFTFQKYISFISGVMLVFGIVFQTPPIVLALNKCGLVELKTLKNIRKYVLFAVFVIAAMLTPPDVISQLFLAGPMYLLFELGVLLCKIK